MDNASDFGKSVMRWASSTITDARYKIDGLFGTEIERKVKEATSNEGWGCSNTLKNEIARATFEYGDTFEQIITIIWERLDSTSWRVVFKTLSLLNHLIKCGSPRILNDCRIQIYRIRALLNFYSVDDEEIDRGKGIRELSKNICRMLEDDKAFKIARDEASRINKRLESNNSLDYKDNFARTNNFNRGRDEMNWIDNRANFRYVNDSKKNQIMKNKKKENEDNWEDFSEFENDNLSDSESESLILSECEKEQSSASKNKDKTFVMNESNFDNKEESLLNLSNEPKLKKSFEKSDDLLNTFEISKPQTQNKIQSNSNELTKSNDFLSQEILDEYKAKPICNETTMSYGSKKLNAKKVDEKERNISTEKAKKNLENMIPGSSLVNLDLMCTKNNNFRSQKKIKMRKMGSKKN